MVSSHTGFIVPGKVLRLGSMIVLDESPKRVRTDATRIVALQVFHVQIVRSDTIRQRG